MNDITTEACKKWGLIQLKDIIWGLSICDSEPAQFFGCPHRVELQKEFPHMKYDETIYSSRTQKPNFMDFI